ncbi:MAG: Cna B-type domain-containing protein [Eubacteriales bacterium]|nr:Cna B-type domain-containing protein [Eubacteriales bacterium]
MRNLFRKALTLTLALLMVLSLGVTALADTVDTFKGSTNMFVGLPGDKATGSTPQADGGNDQTKIEVSKTFIGLPAELVPSDFYLTVKHDVTNTTFTLNKSNTISQETMSDGTIVWKWALWGVSGGSYTITEYNENNVDGYECVERQNANTTIPIQEANLTISNVVDYTANNSTVFPLSEGDFIYVVQAKATLVVFSRDTIEERYKPTLESKIRELGKNYRQPPIVYCSLEQNPNVSYPINGGTVVCDGENLELRLSDKSIWTKYATMTPLFSQATQADLPVTNTYELLNTTLTVNKVWNDEGFASLRPSNLQVQLWQRSGESPNFTDVEYGEPVTIDATNNNWTHTFADLPLKNDAGESVTYFVTELNVPDYYSSSIGAVAPDTDGNDTVTITNTIQVTNVIIEKQVTGNMGDVNKEFSFTVTSTLPIGSVGEGGTLSEDKKTATFNLKDDGTIQLSGIPDGAVLTIKETNADGYTMSVGGTIYPLADGFEYTVETDGNDATEFTITVTNDKEVEIDTGIFLDSLPYILILSIVAVGFVLMRRRRGYED